ncbi:GNAT family N-acetyltransferase [Kitasatospora sp. NPDC051853]|uniref:GNAT family N-acetyltransferase n=1 Tax=Kitasatospora sp. NPDC051853 TaxID=3364058 RepID=UPI00378E55B9
MPHPDPLANPAHSALFGPHAALAERRGRAARYPADVSPFHALPDDPTEADWADLAALTGPGGFALLAGTGIAPPAGWQVTFSLDGVQLVGDRLAHAHDPEAVELGPEDVPEMLALVAATRPGPFEARTIALGRYLGLRQDGVLVAMAGERMHPVGHTEISAVCTAPSHRGRGLAARLVRAVAAGIRDRDEVPFLHAAGDNVDAIRLYKALGFTQSRSITFLGAVAPGGEAPDA